MVFYHTQIKNGTSSYKKLKIKCYIFYNEGTFPYFYIYRLADRPTFRTGLHLLNRLRYLALFEYIDG